MEKGEVFIIINYDNLKHGIKWCWLAEAWDHSKRYVLYIATIPQIKRFADCTNERLAAPITQAEEQD